MDIVGRQVVEDGSYRFMVNTHSNETKQVLKEKQSVMTTTSTLLDCVDRESSGQDRDMVNQLRGPLHSVASNVKKCPLKETQDEKNGRLNMEFCKGEVELARKRMKLAVENGSQMSIGDYYF